MNRHEFIEGILIYSDCETIPGGGRLQEAFYRLSQEFPECFESRRIYFDTNGPYPNSDEVSEAIQGMSYSGILEPFRNNSYSISDRQRIVCKESFSGSASEKEKLSKSGQRMHEILEEYERR